MRDKTDAFRTNYSGNKRWPEGYLESESSFVANEADAFSLACNKREEARVLLLKARNDHYDYWKARSKVAIDTDSILLEETICKFRGRRFSPDRVNKLLMGVSMLRDTIMACEDRDSSISKQER